MDVKKLYLIYQDSCDVSRGSYRSFMAFSSGLVDTVSDVFECDYIVIFDTANGKGWKLCPKQRPDAVPVFVYSESDSPEPLFKGVYVSLLKASYYCSINRGGAYIGYLEDEYTNTIAGNNEVVDRAFFVSFIGRRSHLVRSRILKRFKSQKSWMLLDTTDTYDHWGDSPRDKRVNYYKTLNESTFALCPRGKGASAIRIYEAMRAGAIPVIISNDWVAPTGPDWSSISVRVNERDLNSLPEILKAYSMEDISVMRESGIRAYQKYFSQENAVSTIIEQLNDLNGYSDNYLSRRAIFSMAILHKELLITLQRVTKLLNSIYKKMRSINQ